jgi:hypothetical protein
VNVASVAILQPRVQLLEARLRIGENLRGLTAITQQRSMKRVFRDIDPEE